MLLTLPDELLLLIFSHLKETKYYLDLRLTCKKLYNMYNEIPFYYMEKHVGTIYLQQNIYWRDKIKKKILREILFEPYGRIRVNVYNKMYFRDSINYDLPKQIRQIKYANSSAIISNMDIKNNKLTTHEIPYPTVRGMPGCVIS